MPGPVLRLENVSICYGSRRALDEVTFSARAGELIFVTGRSGAGKTSLLRLINGELPVDTGKVWAAGIPLHAGRREAARVRRHVGVVFQDYGLIRSMTALENVEFAYRVSHVWETGRTARRKASDVLANVGLGDRFDAFPAELSGGEQQRLAIGRAVVCDPDVLLADEPTGNLDAENGACVLSHLEAAAERGALVVVATHDPYLLQVGRRRLHFEDGMLIEESRIRARAS